MFCFVFLFQFYFHSQLPAVLNNLHCEYSRLIPAGIQRKGCIICNTDCQNELSRITKMQS